MIPKSILHFWLSIVLSLVFLWCQAQGNSWEDTILLYFVVFNWQVPNISPLLYRNIVSWWNNFKIQQSGAHLLERKLIENKNIRQILNIIKLISLITCTLQYTKVSEGKFFKRKTLKTCIRNIILGNWQVFP